MDKNLLYTLVIKELKIRYQRPLLGFFWLVLSPFLTVAVFYLIFSLILKVRIEEAPFILYLMSAVFPWRFFQDSLLSSVSSLMENRNLIRESRFSHCLIPISIVLANMIHFLPSLVILIVTSLFILKGLSVFIIFLPVVLAAHISITMGFSVIFSILYVRWRDIKYVLEPFLLLLFYLTPAFYSLSLVKASFSPTLFKLYLSNPFVCLLNLYRLAILKGFYQAIKEEARAYLVFMPVILAVIVILLAVYLYRKNKNSINDYLSY